MPQRHWATLDCGWRIDLWKSMTALLETARMRSPGGLSVLDGLRGGEVEAVRTSQSVDSNGG